MKYREVGSVILQAFDNATAHLNDETAAEALWLARAFFGEDTKEHSPAVMLASGFLIGMDEGMKIAELLDATAAEQVMQ